MTSMSDLIESLNPDQLYALAKDIKSLPKNRVRVVDTSYRARRNNITDLYFKSVPSINLFQSYEVYSEHAEAIRQQCLSGVDL